MDELHGRLLWTTLPSTGDFTDCGVIVHVDYPFLGNSVQTALIAMDDSLDERELGSFFCSPISCPFVQGVVQDIVVILKKVLLFVSHVSRSHWWAGCVDPISQRSCYVSTFEWPASLQ